MRTHPASRFWISQGQRPDTSQPRASESPRAVLGGLTGRVAAWDFSHMQKQMTLVKADEKGRIVIRGTRRGCQYLVTTDRGGWWVMPAPQVKAPARGLEALVAETWEKLGPAPEIDYDRI